MADRARMVTARWSSCPEPVEGLVTSVRAEGDQVGDRAPRDAATRAQGTKPSSQVASELIMSRCSSVLICGSADRYALGHRQRGLERVPADGEALDTDRDSSWACCSAGAGARRRPTPRRGPGRSRDRPATARSDSIRVDPQAVPCTSVSSTRQVAPTRSGGTYAPASSTSTSCGSGWVAESTGVAGTRRKIGPSLDSSPCRPASGGGAKACPGQLAELVGDLRRRSEHAANLLDADGIQAELTHDRHGSEQSGCTQV